MKQHRAITNLTPNFGGDKSTTTEIKTTQTVTQTTGIEKCREKPRHETGLSLGQGLVSFCSPEKASNGQ